MREVTNHKVKETVDAVRIFAEDEVGKGGAHWHYRLSVGMPGNEATSDIHLRFQRGPLTVDGVNGITNEALLAVVLDRLRCWQGDIKGEKGIGSLQCRENAIAITKIEEALMWLHQRTRDRVKREVEGTYQV